MKRGLNSQGFTIVETMIFLAVSSALLISAITLVGGSQNKAQFNTALNDANEQITKVINNVANGYYPNTSSTCTDTGNPNTLFQGAVDTSNIGNKSNCVYLGRLIEFSDGEELNVYNLVGLREVGGRVNTDIQDSKATAFTPPETINLKNGLTVESITLGNNSGNYGSLAFLTSLGEKNTDGVLVSGALSSDFIPLNDNGLSGADGFQSAVTELKNNYASRNPSSGVKICFRSGSTDQFGIITIGGSNKTATTSVVVSGSCS